jgi:Papain family cysteine protease
MSSETEKKIELEIGCVLYPDIVGYSIKCRRPDEWHPDSRVNPAFPCLRKNSKFYARPQKLAGTLFKFSNLGPKKGAPMSIKTKTLNVHADSPDFRDRIYNPTLQLLKKVHNPRPFAERAWASRVKNQEETSACTGFALASLVEALADKARTGKKGLPAISPFMLYFFARKYDEIPGDAVDEGSTARGGMKAWHKHGACELQFWPKLDTNLKNDSTKWIADAFKTPLGAYYRVDHTSIPDLHAALNETGVIYVTAQVHSGWDKVAEDGLIAFDEKSKQEGGHAFLFVGYDEEGFWIQNSWGNVWANNGFARISYNDWQRNGMDAWVGQLGVHISRHVNDLEYGLNFDRVRGKVRTMAGTQSLLLSSDANLSAQQINPYIIDLENNGTLSDGGQFATEPDDLNDLLGYYLPQALDQWKLPANRPIDVAIYAHGGLTPEESAAKTARTWVPALFAQKIFPVFLMWETGWADILKAIAKDALDRVKGVAGVSFWGKAQDWWNERIENLVSGLGTLEWDEMKENAEAASTNSKGGLQMLYQELKKDEHAALRPRLRFHLIGHSAGAVLHAHLAEALVRAGLEVDGIYFLAPACRVDLFKAKLLPLYQAGKIRAYTQFHLRDTIERQDTCMNIYHRSLLYLVSNAFEHGRNAPILGMEAFVKKLPTLSKRPAPAQVWDWIAAPTSAGDLAERSSSTSHGGFDDDEDTRVAVIERIVRRQNAATASNIKKAKAKTPGKSRR